MRVRMKDKPEVVFYAGMFNIHGIGEVIGYGETFGSDLFYTADLDVLLGEEKESWHLRWKDMRQAFKDHDLITDNYNTRFFEPVNEEDRKRGYTL